MSFNSFIKSVSQSVSQSRGQSIGHLFFLSSISFFNSFVSLISCHFIWFHWHHSILFNHLLMHLTTSSLRFCISQTFQTKPLHFLETSWNTFLSHVRPFAFRRLLSAIFGHVTGHLKIATQNRIRRIRFSRIQSIPNRIGWSRSKTWHKKPIPL